MKLITAIIKPYKLDEVREALSEVGQSGDDILPFMRAGTGKSAKSTRLYWMGD